MYVLNWRRIRWLRNTLYPWYYPCIQYKLQSLDHTQKPFHCIRTWHKNHWWPWCILWHTSHRMFQHTRVDTDSSLFHKHGRCHYQLRWTFWWLRGYLLWCSFPSVQPSFPGIGIWIQENRFGESMPPKCKQEIKMVQEPISKSFYSHVFYIIFSSFKRAWIKANMGNLTILFR